MSHGTNFPSGIRNATHYSGNVDTTNDLKTSVNTRFLNRTAIIHCLGADADNSERTTAFTLPTNAIVTDVFINVLTADTGETVDIGTEGSSNDPNGFLAAASLATLGIVRGSLVDGATVTVGALLFEITEATTASTRNVAVTAGGDPVSFTCSSGTDTAIFDIIIEYIEVL